jgi:cation diffusion facilitator family transporter
MQAALDQALTTNERGIRAVKLSLATLLITAFFQVGVVLFTGSVALLANTVHNFSDALTALPLWLAFSLARRARNPRYTYGYGRAEDLAGALIVGMIFATALEIFWQAYDRIVHPRPLENLGWVAAAAVIGFLGNELVALFRIRVGRQIGSAALVADGLHARADGFTSLGVLAGAIGVWLGFPLADPMVALMIGAIILGIVAQAARDIWYRFMDAVDPTVCAKIEAVTQTVPDVLGVHDVCVRWVGHRQRAELHIEVNDQMTTVQGRHIAEEVRHALLHALPELIEITVHVDPCRDGLSAIYHEVTAHHFSPTGEPRDDADQLAARVSAHRLATGS